MKTFIHKSAPYIVLAACVLFTIFAEHRSNAPAPSPAREAAALSARQKHFAGEALPLRPYLPDESVWNESFGMWQAHAALDIACEGDFRAPADGTAAKIFTDPLWGICMEIDMGEGALIVRSLRSVCVQEGEKIRAGDVIGKAGCAPCEADLGTHVHIEYLRGGVPADPIKFFR